MSSKHRRKALIPRSEDPLGFGLRSIPEPLQRLWLVRRGNPEFEREVKAARTALGIPGSGFSNGPDYVDWLARRWERHGHNDALPVYLVAKGVRLPDSESMTLFFNRDLQLPPEDPVPAPCCDADPLFEAAWQLVRAYGIDQAEEEPGFQGLKQDVAGYILSSRWPPRRSYRGYTTIYEKDVLVNPRTGERFRERHVVKELGIETRAGDGGLLPVWYQWWRQVQDGTGVSDIEDWTAAQFGKGAWYDERSIQKSIREVERLMRPITI